VGKPVLSKTELKKLIETNLCWQSLYKQTCVELVGIKQEFPVYLRALAHMRRSPMAVKGLVYMVTDKGPQRQWL